MSVATHGKRRLFELEQFALIVQFQFLLRGDGDGDNEHFLRLFIEIQFWLVNYDTKPNYEKCDFLWTRTVTKRTCEEKATMWQPLSLSLVCEKEKNRKTVIIHLVLQQTIELANEIAVRQAPSCDFFYCRKQTASSKNLLASVLYVNNVQSIKLCINIWSKIGHADCNNCWQTEYVETFLTLSKGKQARRGCDCL